MGTVVVGIIVAGVVALAVRSMVRDKKNGKSIQCAYPSDLWSQLPMSERASYCTSSPSKRPMRPFSPY